MFNIEDKDVDFKLPPEEIDPLLKKIEEEGKVSKDILISLESRFPDYKLNKKLLNSLTAKPSSINVDKVYKHLLELKDIDSTPSYEVLLKQLEEYIVKLINNKDKIKNLIYNDIDVIPKLYIPESLRGELATDHTALGDIEISNLIKNDFIYKRYNEYSLIEYLYTLDLNIIPFVTKTVLMNILNDNSMDNIKKVYYTGTVKEFLHDNIEFINFITEEGDNILDNINTIKILYLENNFILNDIMKKLPKLLIVMQKEYSTYLIK